MCIVCHRHAPAEHHHKFSDQPLCVTRAVPFQTPQPLPASLVSGTGSSRWRCCCRSVHTAAAPCRICGKQRHSSRQNMVKQRYRRLRGQRNDAGCPVCRLTPDCSRALHLSPTSCVGTGGQHTVTLAMPIGAPTATILTHRTCKTWWPCRPPHSAPASSWSPSHPPPNWVCNWPLHPAPATP